MLPLLGECRNKGHTAYVHTEIHKPEMRIAAHRMNRNVRDGCFHDAGFHNPGHTEGDTKPGWYPCIGCIGKACAG